MASADALGGTGYERDAVVEADVHVSIRAWNVSNDIGRRPSSISWISATRRVERGRRNAGLAAERRDDADLRIDLGLAFSHGEIAVDAGMRLGGVAVELGQRRDRGTR